jgi:hypothetical protein
VMMVCILQHLTQIKVFVYSKKTTLLVMITDHHPNGFLMEKFNHMKSQSLVFALAKHLMITINLTLDFLVLVKIVVASNIM